MCAEATAWWCDLIPEFIVYRLLSFLRLGKVNPLCSSMAGLQATVASLAAVLMYEKLRPEGSTYLQQLSETAELAQACLCAMATPSAAVKSLCCLQAFSRRGVHAFRAAIEGHGSERCCVVRCTTSTLLPCAVLQSAGL